MYLVGWVSHWPLTILIYRFCLIVYPCTVYPGFGGVWPQQIYSEHRASVWCLNVWWQCLGTRIASLFFHWNTPSITVIICTQSDLSRSSTCFLATRQYHPAVCLRFPGLDTCPCPGWQGNHWCDAWWTMGTMVRRELSYCGSWRNLQGEGGGDSTSTMISMMFLWGLYFHKLGK